MRRMALCWVFEIGGSGAGLVKASGGILGCVGMSRGVGMVGSCCGLSSGLELLGEGFGGGSPFKVGAPEWVTVCMGRCAASGMPLGCSFRIWLGVWFAGDFVTCFLGMLGSRRGGGDVDAKTSM